MNLTAKLTALVFVAVAAVTLLATFVAIRFQWRDLEKRHELIAQRLVSSLSGPSHGSDARASLPDALKRIQIETTRTQLRWVQPEATSGTANAARANGPLLAAVTERQIQSVTLQDDRGNTWMHTYVPIPSADGVQAVELSESIEPLLRDQWRLLASSLVTLLAMAGICVAIVFLGGLRLVTRPLERLIAKTNRIGQGDFSGPVEAEGRDEISRLARAINAMCDQLAAQRQALASETDARLATLGQLRHADRLKTVGRLAAGLAHELGTPLNVVSGRAALIASGKLSPAEIVRSAEAIKQESDRITGIMRQLLDYGRASPARKQPLPLNDLVRQTVDLVEPLAQKKHLSLRCESPSASVTVIADTAQMQQVLANLLVNAIQASSEEATVTVRWGTKSVAHPSRPAVTSSHAYLEVIDTGPGMDASILEHVFEPFYTTKNVGEGTGLGLSIAQGIVEEHGGWIDVASTAGTGSRFTVYLPENVSP